ncbi:MAG: tRNA nucleotidyltransferase/poly(A) polymerase family protein [Thermomicrobiales bacterium]
MENTIRASGGVPNTTAFWNALDADQRDILARVAIESARQGGKAYLVGGPVRDFIRGARELRDIDVTTTADAHHIAISIVEHFAMAMNAHVANVTDFGTATVTLRPPGQRGRISLDIATTRTDTYPYPGALPVTTHYAAIADDLARRDFAINAVALPIFNDGFGDIIDPYNGVADIRQRTIRVLYDESFRDDPTRLFRALRYATRFGFKMDVHTAQLFTDAVTTDALRTISADRKRREIELGMLEQGGPACLGAFARASLLIATSPVLLWNDTVEQRFQNLLPHVRDDILRTTLLQRKSRVAEDLWPAWAAFILDQEVSALERLFLDIPMTKRMKASIRHVAHAYKNRGKITEPMPLSQIASWFAGVPFWLVPLLFDEEVSARIATLNLRGSHIQHQNKTEKRFRGGDLNSLGIPNDGWRRKILDALRHARLDGEVETVDEERAFVEHYIKQHGLPP